MPTTSVPTGAITGPVAYFWQSEKRLDEGVFEDIVIATGLGDVRATGTTFTPGDAEAGLRLRVRAVYQDANGVLEDRVLGADRGRGQRQRCPPVGSP